MKTIATILALLVSVVCNAQIIQQASDIKIVNSDNQVKISAYDATQTLPWLEFGSFTNTVFSIPASGIIPVANGGTGTNTASGAKSTLGIQSGTVVMAGNGTITQAFSPVFSSVPTVLNRAFGDGVTSTNRITVTTSNFILSTFVGGQTNNWAAIGAP